MPATPPVPLLVASIGNPAPLYANTLHSAGHTLLEYIRSARGWPAFQRERVMGNGLVSRRSYKRLDWKQGGFVDDAEDPWTLWQSTGLMNASGKGVREAWERWKRDAPEGQGVLVVLHDELEKPLGTVVVRKAGGSARGHNGIKSIQAALPNVPFVRIGIGIGRPESREPDVVAKYVLRKMTDRERHSVESCAGKVIDILEDISEGK